MLRYRHVRARAGELRYLFYTQVTRLNYHLLRTHLHDSDTHKYKIAYIELLETVGIDTPQNN